MNKKIKTLAYLAISIVTTLTISSCEKEVRQLTNLQIKSLDSIATINVPKDAPGIATGIVMDGKIVYENMLAMPI